MDEALIVSAGWLAACQGKEAALSALAKVVPALERVTSGRFGSWLAAFDRGVFGWSSEASLSRSTRVYELGPSVPISDKSVDSLFAGLADGAIVGATLSGGFSWPPGEDPPSDYLDVSVDIVELFPGWACRLQVEFGVGMLLGERQILEEELLTLATEVPRLWPQCSYGRAEINSWKDSEFTAGCRAVLNPTGGGFFGMGWWTYLSDKAPAQLLALLDREAESRGGPLRRGEDNAVFLLGDSLIDAGDWVARRDFERDVLAPALGCDSSQLYRPAVPRIRDDREPLRLPHVESLRGAARRPDGGATTFYEFARFGDHVMLISDGCTPPSVQMTVDLDPADHELLEEVVGAWAVRGTAGEFGGWVHSVEGPQLGEDGKAWIAADLGSSDFEKALTELMAAIARGMRPARVEVK